MKRIDELPKLVRNIVHTQLFGILATQGERFPHTTIVSFVTADNLRSLIFFTPKSTRKMNFLTARSGVAFFIDNRSNSITDLQRVAGIEVQGSASEVTGTDRERYGELYTEKYPELQDFATSPGNAMIRIEVEAYNIVQHFQDVTILEMNPHDI
jgi:general stress protein 26